MKTNVTLYNDELELLFDLINQKHLLIHDERTDFHLNNDLMPHRDWEKKNVELERLFSLSWKLTNKIQEAWHRTIA
jgi:hypothetical protein